MDKERIGLLLFVACTAVLGALIFAAIVWVLLSGRHCAYRVLGTDTVITYSGAGANGGCATMDKFDSVTPTDGPVPGSRQACIVEAYDGRAEVWTTKPFSLTAYALCTSIKPGHP